MSLTTCKECGGVLSTQAQFCPHCGYTEKKKTYSKSKFHRLPNGFGSIRKYSGKRRNPYYAYPSVTDYYDNGSAKPVPCIGSYPTYQEAFEALTKYNKKPYDLEKADITFAEVHKLFYDDKYVNNAKRTYSKSSMYLANAGFNNLKEIHNVPIKKLRTYDMQKIVDACDLSHASLEGIVQCLRNVFSFAIANDLVDVDYAQYVVIKTLDDDEKGVPFTEEEIKKLWEHKNDKIVQYILILIYSGMRISELATMKIDFEKGIMQGGNKTKSSKNRIIPIHPLIADFLKNCALIKTSDDKCRKYFDEKLKELGLSTSVKNTKHTPHDCRHTFSWLADKYKIDDLSKHMIMGHSTGKDVEESVYGHRTNEELIEEMKKIKGYDLKEINENATN